MVTEKPSVSRFERGRVVITEKTLHLRFEQGKVVVVAENTLCLAFRARKGGADRENPPSCVSSKGRVVVMEKTLRLAFQAREEGGDRKTIRLAFRAREGGTGASVLRFEQRKVVVVAEIPSVLRGRKVVTEKTLRLAFRAREGGGGGRKYAPSCVSSKERWC